MTADLAREAREPECPACKHTWPKEGWSYEWCRWEIKECPAYPNGIYCAAALDGAPAALDGGEEPKPIVAGSEDEPDWMPAQSAIGLPEGHKAHGSTGQEWVVRDGRWERIRKPKFQIVASPAAPLDMVIRCPHCGTQHIDKAEPENGWDNPPHTSHLCHNCGAIWRDASVPTNGVVSIPPGKHDRPPMKAPAAPDGLVGVLRGLLEGWKNFQNSRNGGNQEEAYYCLAKYLWPKWEAAEAALAALPAPTPAPEPVKKCTDPGACAAFEACIGECEAAPSQPAQDAGLIERAEKRIALWEQPDSRGSNFTDDDVDLIRDLLAALKAAPVSVEGRNA